MLSAYAFDTTGAKEVSDPSIISDLIEKAGDCEHQPGAGRVQDLAFEVFQVGS